MRVALLLGFVLTPLLTMGQPAWNRILITDQVDGPITVRAVDLDGDGDQDILGSGWFNDQLYWGEQTESGWVGHVIATNFDGNRCTFPADLNADGNLDVLATAYNADEIAWWAQTDSDWVKNSVDAAFNGALNVIAADLDFDGDLDVIGTAQLANQVAWWENQDLQWTKHVISHNFTGAYGIAVSDIDSDGDLDIAACSEGSNEVAWWENDGFIWTKHLLTDRMNSSRSVACADMDGDGDTDIIAEAVVSDEIAWWENRQTSWTKHVVTCNLDGARNMKIIDLDLDGDFDIVATALWVHEVVWFENNQGPDWKKHLISRNLKLAKGVDAADMDGDGDIDVIGGSYRSDTIVMWEQLDSIHPDPTQMSITYAPVPLEVEPSHAFVVHPVINYNIPGSVTMYVWTDILMPNQEIYGPVNFGSFFVDSVFTLDVDSLLQWVPANAPAGIYQYMMYTGLSVENADASTSFDMTVLPPQGEDSAYGHDDWALEGFDIARWTGTETATTPTELLVASELGAAFPNPFNEMTMIPLQLRQTVEVRVVVYNSLGEQVSILQDGFLDAGIHEFSFRAGGFGSGVYFVRAEVDGHPLAARKLLLLR